MDIIIIRLKAIKYKKNFFTIYLPLGRAIKLYIIRLYY